MDENSWCLLCRDTTPHRYYICDAPCEDFMTWVVVTTEASFNQEAANSIELVVPWEDDDE